MKWNQQKAKLNVVRILVSTKIDEKQNNGLNWNILSQNRSEIMGLATLMIVIFHFFQMSNFLNDNLIIDRLAYAFCSGVEIFIFLSGIGLFYSYQKKPALKDFYKKRLLNVYVPYLIIALPYTLWWSFVNRSIILFPLNWALPNYYFGNARDVWYIPFILLMYLLFPLIYKLLFESKIYKYRFLLVIAFSVLWYGLYFFLLRLDNSYFNKAEIGVFRFPIFLFACLLGEAVYYKKKVNSIVAIIISALSLIAIAGGLYFFNMEGKRILTSCSAIVITFILMFIFDKLELRIIRKILLFFASMSLELYLVHLLIFKVLDKYQIVTWYYYLVAIVIALMVSYPLSKLRALVVKKLIK